MTTIDDDGRGGDGGAARALIWLGILAAAVAWAWWLRTIAPLMGRG